MSECSMITSRHCESNAVGWFLKHSFLNNSESERGSRRLPSPNWEPTPKCSNGLEASHYHFPPGQRSETDEDLLKLFRKVEINILLLDTIKQVPKYAKFLKELCIHKRKKLKGGVKMGGIVSALTKHEEVIAGL
ncbi:hypothetical protein CR513_05628, partial [Mucuna pruriens]